LDAIAAIKSKLAKYPQIRYAESDSSIEVQPADVSGFSVSLRQTGDHLTVAFEGWHEAFESETEALNCFAFGLSEACRLRVLYRGNSPVRWTVEAYRDGVWASDSETGLILIPFWRRKSVRYLQNRWLPAA